LYVGTVKNPLHLQHLLAHFSGRKLRQIDPAVQKICCLGLYQLRFLTRIPPSAAVDQAVEQTRRLRLGNATGFVNAVLRHAIREPNAPLPPESDAAEYAELALSHPKPLFEQIVKLFTGNQKNALGLCKRHNEEPPTILRLAPGVTIDQLTGDGVSVTPHAEPGFAVAADAKRADLARWADAGLAQAQDPTSAYVVTRAKLNSPDLLVLDRCCGVGTKTLQILQHVAPGNVWAMDAARQRLAVLQSTLKKRNVEGVRAFVGETLTDAPPDAQLPAEFDRIIVDAPCSNSGVLARRPEARYAQAAGSLKSLVALQHQILADTATRLKPGGLLVYATCSMWPEENEQVVKQFLKVGGMWRLVEQRSTLPSTEGGPAQHHDGGYVAVIERKM
jgi:16S rRNA (cytosine967-C5)-methyltransferase